MEHEKVFVDGHRKFQRFSDQIARADPDQRFKIQTEHEAAGPVATTHFDTLLDRNFQLDISAEFVKFRGAINRLTGSLSSLLHNRERIVSAILESLQVMATIILHILDMVSFLCTVQDPGPQGPAALLTLLCALAKDIKQELWPDFPRILKALVKLISPARVSCCLVVLSEH